MSILKDAIGFYEETIVPQTTERIDYVPAQLESQIAGLRAQQQAFIDRGNNEFGAQADALQKKLDEILALDPTALTPAISSTPA